MRKGKCKHFTGIQHDECSQGVSYKGLECPEKTGIRLPCLLAEGKSYCDKWEEPTDAEVAQHDAAVKAAMDRMMACVPWIGRMKKAFPKGTPMEISECPICQKEIHFRISSYNGHMHAKCTTADCISFME